MTTTDRPATKHTIRAANLGLILRTLRTHAPCSRARLATASGLTKSTVSSLVDELTAAGLITEHGPHHTPTAGRPALMLGPDPARRAVLGLEVNADYLAASALDPTGGQLLTLHTDHDTRTATPQATAQAAADLITRALNHPALAHRTLLGTGIAIPGLIDPATHTVLTSPPLGWTHTPFTDLLPPPPAPTGPHITGNDATLAALAEHRFGHLAHTPDLVYLTGEVGLGAGILTGGTPLTGTRGHAGEIGHVTLEPDGPHCACGRRGCLEALAGIDAILHAAGTAPDPHTPTNTALTHAVATTADNARNGDPRALTALTRAGHRLGQGCAILANLLDPAAIILGGYYTDLAPWLLPPARRTARTHMHAPPPGDLIHPSTLGLTAAAKGGAAAVLTALEEGRIPLTPA
ncbi:ROK family transcriptional regulator [Nocardiopsis halophila]|uniref:ROK family transcriptional regulator n=1 Tax=Nocardiopsis halophila TaxID=141692 RepID=UPI00034B9103|nr:ROK family transcriptional regulator [Nocardiopsis halophila]